MFPVTDSQDNGIAMSLPTSSWRDLYHSRKRKRYPYEATRHDFDHANRTTLVDSLFITDEFSLDPPASLTYLQLRDILKQGCLEPQDASSSGSTSDGMLKDSMYIDDRRSLFSEFVAGKLESGEDWTG